MQIKIYSKVSGFGIKKNQKQIFYNKRTDRRFITTSDNCKKFENELLIIFRKEKMQNNLKMIDRECELNIIFYFPRSKLFTKKNEPNKKRADLSNLIELPQDCLTKSGLILDDRLICTINAQIKQSKTDDYELSISLKEADLASTWS